MIEACFFDIGGVLIDFNRQKMLVDLANLLGMNISSIIELDQKHQLSNQLETGKMQEEQLLTILRQERNFTPSLEQITKSLCTAFTEKKRMLSIIKQIKARNIALFTLSNTNRLHFEYLKKTFPIFQEFDGFVLSYQIGYMKPDKQIYKAALKLANRPASCCFYTDDIDAFCQVGQQMGLSSYHFQSEEGLVQRLIQLGVFNERD